jgi:hypothetical protein
VKKLSVGLILIVALLLPAGVEAKRKFNLPMPAKKPPVYKPYKAKKKPEVQIRYPNQKKS